MLACEIYGHLQSDSGKNLHFVTRELLRTMALEEGIETYEDLAAVLTLPLPLQRIIAQNVGVRCLICLDTGIHYPNGIGTEHEFRGQACSCPRGIEWTAWATWEPEPED